MSVRGALAVIVAVLAVAGCASPEPLAPRPAVAAPVTSTTPPDRTAVVVAVDAPHRFTLDTGAVVDMPSLESGMRTDNDCQREASLAAARELLLGERVTVVAASASYSDPEVTLPGGSSYRTELSSATFEQHTACLPGSDSAGSEGGDTYVYEGGDDNDRESRFCRGRWWC